MVHLRKLAVALVPALTLAAGPAASQEKVFGVITSPTSPMTEAMVKWLENVDAATEGGYPHSVASGGALIGKGTEVSGFEDYIVDGGFVSVLYYPSELPINHMLGNLNLSAKDSRAAGAAVLETVLVRCGDCLDELIDHNIMPVGSYATSPYNMFCKEPGHELADFKGRSIRAVGSLGRLVDAIGGVPVNLGISEIYEGLQRGQLDCTVYTAGTVEDYSYNDVAPYLTVISSGPVYGPSGLALRYDLWEGMDAAERKVFVDAAAEAVTHGIYDYYEQDSAVLGNPDQYKLTIGEPGPELAKAIDDYAQANMDMMVAEAEKQGVANAREIATTFHEVLNKWDGILGELGDDRAAFAEALNREIYAKFPLDR